MWVNEGSRRVQMKGDRPGLGTCRGNRKAVDLSIVSDWYVSKWRSGGQGLVLLRLRDSKGQENMNNSETATIESNGRCLKK
jgi:hypothetical protein